MDGQQMKSVIEGLLFVAGDEGMDARQLAAVLDTPIPTVLQLVEELKEQLQSQERGIQLMEIAGSYQLTTLPAHAPFFAKLAESPSRATLSQAALETLAIVAYKQPITRIDIEEIRGVKSDRAIQTLVAKTLIQGVGRADAVGRPILYGTTKQFLTYFGLKEIGELPEVDAGENGFTFAEHSDLLFDRLDGEQLAFSDDVYDPIEVFDDLSEDEEDQYNSDEE